MKQGEFRSRLRGALGACVAISVLLSSVVAAETALPAAAPPEETFIAVARVTQVLSETEFVVGRGSAEGLTVGAENLQVNPMRAPAEGEDRELEVSVRLGLARVIAVQEHSATLQLTQRYAAVAVGDVAYYKIQVPPAWQGDPLFYVAANDTRYAPIDGGEPFYQFSAIFADTTAHSRDAIMAALLDDIHAVSERGKGTVIEGGPYHGRDLGEVLAAATLQDLRTYLEYANEYAGTTVARDYSIAERFAAWIEGGAPTVERAKRKRESDQQRAVGDEAMRTGDVEAAEEVFRAALKISPDDPDLRARLDRALAIRTSRERLLKDPDDTATRWAQMLAYMAVDANTQAMTELEAAEKSGYDKDSCIRYRGYLLVKLSRFAEAAVLLEQLATRLPDDKDLAGWIKFAQAKARLQAEPDSFDAQMQVALVHEEDRSWDEAVLAYRIAITFAKTPEQAAEAAAGQERIAALREADRQFGVAENEIRNHRVLSAVDSGKRALEVCTRASSIPCVLRGMERMADAANTVWEVPIAIQWRRARTELDPTEDQTWIDLADSLVSVGEFTQAREAAEKALAIKPPSHIAYKLHALASLGLEEFAAVTKAADAGAALAPAHEWPWRMRATVAAAAGDWAAAEAAAKETLKRGRSETAAQELYRAVVLGRGAADQIAAQKDVPRNRLRLVRAYVPLKLYERAGKQAELLKGTPYYRDAMWCIGSTTLGGRPDEILLAAVEASGAATPVRKVLHEILLARLAVAKESTTEARTRLARAWNAAGQYHRALEALGDDAWESDSALAREAGDAARRGLSADALAADGAEALRREDPHSALKIYQEADAIYVAVNSISDVLSTRFAIVGALGSTQATNDAIRLAADTSKLAADYGEPVTAARLAALEAQYEAISGQLDPAAAALAHQVEVALEQDDSPDAWPALTDAVAIAAEQGRIREAFRLAEQGMIHARNSGREFAYRAALATMSDLNLTSGRLAESARLAEELLDLARLDKYVPHERFALAILGAVSMRRGDAPKALDYLEQTFKLGLRAGNTGDRITARRLQGETLLNVAHDPAGAIARYQQADEIPDDDAGSKAAIWLGLGKAHAAAGKLEPALANLKRACEQFRSQGRKDTLGETVTELAHAELKAGHVDAALAAATEATSIADSTDDIKLAWMAWHVFGRVQERLGHNEPAAAAYEKAVTALVEEMGRGSSESDSEGWLGYGRIREVFGDAVDLLFRMGRVDRAMDVAQRSRDAQLRSKLDPSKIKSAQPELQQTLADVGDAKARAEAAQKARAEELAKPEADRNAARLETLSQIAAKTEGQLRQLLAQLQVKHRNLYAMLAFTPDSVEDLREALPDDVVVVQYFITDDATYIFTLRKDRAQTRAIKVPLKGEELSTTIDDYLEALRTEMPRAPQLGAKLYGWLLAPIDDELSAAHTVLLVPFGKLHYVPFQALNTLDADGTPHYAIERFRLGYLSSRTLYKLAKAHQKSSNTLLAFANPDGTLLGARAEMESVMQNGFPTAKVLYEKDAVKDSFFKLASSYRIIHFATHGIVTSDPTTSFLKMADAELTVNDIIGFEGLEGKTDLVVLSACQTALEKGQKTEDEPISIASAFASAGAPSLVASLWSVNDESTRELMSHFYEGLKQGGVNGMDTLEALRQAQLAVMRLELNGGRPYEAPRYWAAFELVGDYR